METMETKTTQGLDKLQLMVLFLNVFEGNNPKIHFINLKIWLTKELRRPLKTTEELKILQAIEDYINTEPETSERSNSIEYLFNASFLE